jgi:hypothetical protein
MGATNLTGPLFVSGDLEQLEASPGGAILLPDPNPDRGPSMLFGGYGLPDTRYTFLKDTVQGYAGRVPELLVSPSVVSVNAIPAAHGAAVIAAAANVTSGTAMTLVTTASFGIAPGIPIVPFTGTLNGAAPVTPAMVLDFGFAYGTTTTGATAQTVTVLDSTLFPVGMPLVIANAGAASGTTPLLTWVTGQPTATTITINNPALQAGSFPIGSGNLWSPSEFGQLIPTAHLPMVNAGPGLFMDPRQSIARGIVVTANNAAGVGGAVVVRGYDVYWQPMAESITITPGTALAAYGKKAFKALASVTPAFTDGTYTYSIGTSDVFGFVERTDYLEETMVWWGGALSAGANYGFVAADTTNPATATTGDVRGTIQTSAIGGGTGLGSTASNGSVSTITVSGNRLRMASSMTVWQQTQNRLAAPQYGFGQVNFTE